MISKLSVIVERQVHHSSPARIGPASQCRTWIAQERFTVRSVQVVSCERSSIVAAVVVVAVVSLCLQSLDILEIISQGDGAIEVVLLLLVITCIVLVGGCDRVVLLVTILSAPSRLAVDVVS